MQKPDFNEAIEQILRADPRYDRGAYCFVCEGLDYTVKMLRKSGDAAARHVTGQELLEGLRRYALDQFGPMAKTVLMHWGIRQCEDFGDIVFNMVNKGVLGKTERDSLEDFKAGFDFDDAFVKPFRPPRSAGLREGNIDAGRERFRAPSRSSDPEKLSSSSN
jgi:uncharacterized repeat protein (TIGR04138 family)